MDRQRLNEGITRRGEEFFNLIGKETPSLFDRGHWMGKIMDWCMNDLTFKVQMLRFVDVFPTLRQTESLNRHIQEYFADDSLNLPGFLKAGAKGVGWTGKFGTLLVGGALKQQIRSMGKQFIIGENAGEAVRNLEKLRQQGFGFVVDLLGEATVCEEEAAQTQTAYMELLDNLAQRSAQWTALGEVPDTDLDWGHAPPINLSIKPTSFYSQTRAADFAGSVAALRKRIEPLYQKIISAQGFLCIDMEATPTKEITLELFRQLRTAYPEQNRLGIVLQAYLKEGEKDLDNLLQWARKEELPISIRLVKGAYWDQETIKAQLSGWPVPVHQVKAASDATFEKMAWTILENHEICHLACASHNIRSICAILEMADQLNVPPDKYEFQLLYGMAEPIRKALLKLTRRVRLYCPYGELLPGMAYLVRRLLENTSNDSFLRQSFADGVDIGQLMADPVLKLEHTMEPSAPEQPFASEPALDFTDERQVEAFREALEQVEGCLGREYPLHLDGREVRGRATLPSLNPAQPSQVIGVVHQGGTEEAEMAVAAATAALPPWRDTPVKMRAEVLRKAANLSRQRIFELSAWQVLEVGKQWDQAYGDVTEGIDFLEYYADQMEALAEPQQCGTLSGEDNRYFYQPKGVALVISPWNFPFAISVGMTAAALVTGNTVIYKPSGLSSVTGALIVQILHEAGLPEGVLNFLPGPGSEIGDLLVDHPGIHLIAFTGSLKVGLRINQRAAVLQPGQTHIKKVVCEMGGKNAIIIDDDADIDEAIPHILYSAFAYQGQKCSACSRLIVVNDIYDRFVDRLVKAARTLVLGPAAEPKHHLGPVVDPLAKEKILTAADTAAREGTLLYRSDVPQGDGYYVPITIVGDIGPEHDTAQHEIFGPVLAVMRASDFDQAMDWALETPYALTGGVFSRSPSHLDRARQKFRVGNLYLNRNNTGALVYRQPFGGFGLSGGGTKAGGPDYLLHFMDPRVVTENTLRRGFAPEQLD